MEIIVLHSESVNVEDCVRHMKEKIESEVISKHGKISKGKVEIGLGAFASLKIVIAIDETTPSRKGAIIEYAVGKSKEGALKKLQDEINEELKKNLEIVDFEIATYTTPVTRRTYAVGVVLYNVPTNDRKLAELDIKERRELLSKTLSIFNYNPKVLNISEVARVFGVSRDSIYYDIEQILKERKKNYFV